MPSGMCSEPTRKTAFSNVKIIGQPRRLALLACAFLFLAGQAFIPRLGFEDNEALFAAAILQPRGELHFVTLGHAHVSTMLLSYLGALKAWTLGPLIRNVQPSVWMVREPVLLAGAATVWIFYLLLRRLAGERAALAGACLLAVDPLNLLTTCFDWGPVALQHLLVTGALYCLVAFCQDRRDLQLAAGCLLLGLAFWDKALAAWIVSGLAIGAVAVVGARVARVVTYRRAAIALLSFTAGCLPLIVYNVQTGWPTLRGNFVFDASEIGSKARLLKSTLTGEALFGYLASEDWETPVARVPEGSIQRASTWISQSLGHPRSNLSLYGLAIALLLTPLASQRIQRVVAIAAIAIAVAWIQMAITANAGASVHHTILLWPLPQLIIAVSLAAASQRLKRAGRPVLIGVLTILMLSSAGVTNEYHAQMVKNGGSASWTEALFPAVDYLKAAGSSKVFCMDWGILNGMRLASKGKLPLAFGIDSILKPNLSADDERVVRYMVSNPEHVFVAHSRQAEFYKGTNQRLTTLASGLGFHRQAMTIIADSRGRQMFEIFRFSKSQQLESATRSEP
jgi:4-amino-4-deoxy-L-arabinose transferase-like glycosyltransferase